MILKFLKSLFAWEPVFCRGVWLYERNAVTGQRRCTLRVKGGYSPVDFEWLDAGKGHPLINGIPAWRSGPGWSSGRYC